MPSSLPPLRKAWFEGPDSRLATATTRALASAGTTALASAGKRKLGRGGLPSPLRRDPLEAMRVQALVDIESLADGGQLIEGR
jgi:hypothetical protein